MWYFLFQPWARGEEHDRVHHRYIQLLGQKENTYMCISGFSLDKIMYGRSV